MLFDDEATMAGGHYIVQALAVLYECSSTSSDLREYIKEYIGVQVTLRDILLPVYVAYFTSKYNAIMEHATASGSNIYAMSAVLGN